MLIANSEWRKALGLPEEPQRNPGEERNWERVIKSARNLGWRCQAGETYRIVNCRIAELVQGGIVTAVYKLPPEPTGRHILNTVGKNLKVAAVRPEARLLFLMALLNCPSDAGKPDPIFPEKFWYPGDPDAVKQWIPIWPEYTVGNISAYLAELEGQRLIERRTFASSNGPSEYLSFPFGHLYPQSNQFRPRLRLRATCPNAKCGAKLIWGERRQVRLNSQKGVVPCDRIIEDKNACPLCGSVVFSLEEARQRLLNTILSVEAQIADTSLF